MNPPNQIIFTSLVNLEQVKLNTDALKIAPGIFQDRIQKSYEVRATVIGDRIYSVRINSQDYQETELDWRRDQLSLNYFRIELPKKIKKLILAMNQRLGLVFGAYDLVVTPSDEYVFLEVNPLGQWLWLEEKTGVPISRTLAEYLAT